MNYIQSAIYDVIKQFVAKQSIALEIMEKLHPDILLKTNSQIPTEEIYESINAHSNLPYVGKYEEWNYWFHGTGCKLSHQVTNEPIEWDAPDTNVFDFYWLVNWFDWYIESDIDHVLSSTIKARLNEQPTSLSKITFSVLEELKAMNLVLHFAPKFGTKYSLTWGIC